MATGICLESIEWDVGGGGRFSKLNTYQNTDRPLSHAELSAKGGQGSEDGPGRRLIMNPELGYTSGIDLEDSSNHCPNRDLA
jgi:hypothetical protein